MPTGPKGQKRPADVIGAAVKVMRIATGEEEEELDRAKSAAAELGSRGGKERAATMTPEDDQKSPDARRLSDGVTSPKGVNHSIDGIANVTKVACVTHAPIAIGEALP